MSLLIVEGPDCAGKTTLIETIVQHYPPSTVNMEHHGAYLDEQEIAHHYLRSIARGFLLPGRLTIMDRSWLSEPIYGHAMRGGKNRINEYERNMLETAAGLAKAKIIFCMPPYEVCLEKWLERRSKEYLDVTSQFHEVYHVYHNLIKRRSRHVTLPFFIYDYTNPGNGFFESLNLQVE